MSTGAGELRGPLVALVCAALLPLAACSDDRPPPTYSGGGYDDVSTLMQRTLNQRAVALATGDLTRFRRTLDRTDAGLLDSEQTYFDNLAQLPVGRLRISVVDETISPIEGTELDGGTEYWAEVVVALRLDGYDAAPVRTRDRFRFVPTADGSRLLVGSTTDYGWEEQHPGNAQPWDLGEVHVAQAPGVLGIFDDWTDDEADEVMDAASAGRSDVRAVVGPGDAASVGGVVVYSLQDPTFLEGLAGQTVGDPDRADGLTIAVPVDSLAPARGAASYRIFVNPRVLDEPEVVVGRLVRHELTHAVLGSRGRGAPLWLNEGIAEYVSVRPMAPGARRLPSRALEVGATATDLPGQAEFASSDAEAWYAVSWWVCEYVASTYGEDVLLALLDRLAGGADQDRVLEEVLGLGSAQLAQRGVALMTTTYGSAR